MGPRSPLRFGRRRADIPRMSCGLRSATVGAEQTSPGCLAVSAPLRSAQSRHPPDVLRSPLRFGRRRADIPRMSCGLRSASVGAEQTSPGCLAVSAPLRSLQNRRPPDVLQPIFRKAPVVAGQAPMGPRSPLRFGRCRTDVPPDVLQPIFRKDPVVAGQALYNDKTGKVRFL